jgi:hypothetical protein
MSHQVSKQRLTIMCFGVCVDPWQVDEAPVLPVDPEVDGLLPLRLLRRVPLRALSCLPVTHLASSLTLEREASEMGEDRAANHCCRMSAAVAPSCSVVRR